LSKKNTAGYSVLEPEKINNRMLAFLNQAMRQYGLTITTKMASGVLQMHELSVVRNIRLGRLISHKIRGTRGISQTDLMEFVATAYQDDTDSVMVDRVSLFFRELQAYMLSDDFKRKSK
jgi:hypothetical protein